MNTFKVMLGFAQLFIGAIISAVGYSKATLEGNILFLIGIIGMIMSGILIFYGILIPNNIVFSEEKAK